MKRSQTSNGLVPIQPQSRLFIYFFPSETLCVPVCTQVQLTWDNFILTLPRRCASVAIDFRSNLDHWIFIIWEIQFWNWKKKKKLWSPCPLRSTKALIMPHFGIIYCLLLREERIPSNNCKIFCGRDSWEHALTYSQYIVSDTSKHFRFD